MILKRAMEIDRMAEAAALNRSALEAVEAVLEPGVTTRELNDVAERAIVAGGGTPAFKGYRGFPASLCTSVNEVVVHGIPSDRRLREGDIVSIDVGTFLGGYAADMARTYAIGSVSDEARRLLDVTERSLWAGIDAMQPGKRVGDVSAAIQNVVEDGGFWVIREFVGHGIGREFHEGPEVANFGRAGTGPVLRPGLVLAVEPMVAARRTSVVVLDDEWTAPTEDGSLAAHFEHTIAVTEDGPRILTARPEETQQAAPGGAHGA